MCVGWGSFLCLFVGSQNPVGKQLPFVILIDTRTKDHAVVEGSRQSTYRPFLYKGCVNTAHLPMLRVLGRVGFIWGTTRRMAVDQLSAIGKSCQVLSVLSSSPAFLSRHLFPAPSKWGVRRCSSKEHQFYPSYAHSTSLEHSNLQVTSPVLHSWMGLCSCAGSEARKTCRSVLSGSLMWLSVLPCQESGGQASTLSSTTGFLGLAPLKHLSRCEERKRETLLQMMLT